MKTAKHSKKDNRGHLWVACYECNRGGNSIALDKCSCGFQTKKWNQMGCFAGTLLTGLEAANG